MHKIVAKPNLIADDVLNGKIERIFNNPLFQRMVERAEIIPVSASSPKAANTGKNREVVDKKQLQAMLIRGAVEEKRKREREAAEEELPHFGAEAKAKEDAKSPSLGELRNGDEGAIVTPIKPSKGATETPINTAAATGKANDSFGAIDKDKGQATSPKKYSLLCETHK